MPPRPRNLENDQMPSKLKKMTEILQNLKNDQNTFRTFKMTKVREYFGLFGYFGGIFVFIEVWGILVVLEFLGYFSLF